MPPALSRRTVNGPMDTLGERMRELAAAGWVEQLSIRDAGLRCDGCRCWAGPDEVFVDVVYRFEGPSDPADEAILFAVTMPCGHRGVLPATYGKDTEPDVVEVVKRLRLTRG